MFFGTPHKGAEKAVLLKSLLKATFSDRGYVEDLVPNGRLLNGINNAFGGDACKDLKLVSYRETTKVFGVGVICPCRP